MDSAGYGRGCMHVIGEGESAYCGVFARDIPSFAALAGIGRYGDWTAKGRKYMICAGCAAAIAAIADEAQRAFADARKARIDNVDCPALISGEGCEARIAAGTCELWKAEEAAFWAAQAAAPREPYLTSALA